MPRRDHAVLALACAACAACSLPLPVYAPDPIPLEQAGTGGGLLAMGTAGTVTTPFPMLVDTGSPLTSYADGTQAVSAARGSLSLYSSGGDAGSVPRLELEDVLLFTSPVQPSGLDAQTTIGGVLGGDNLSRFVVGLRYAPAPSISLVDDLILDDCQIGDRCGTVLPVSLAGGHQQIDVGEDVYSYPASYVLLDACVEPTPDPLEAATECNDVGCFGTCAGVPAAQQASCTALCNLFNPRGCDQSCTNALSSPACAQCVTNAARYVSSGIDVRFVVATGFPGIGITASAYDRLRGAGAAEALLAAPTHTLFLPDESAVPVALATLGNAGAGTDPTARSALALIDAGGYFGACDEMARSRRLRRVPNVDSVPTTDGSCLRWPGRYTYPAQSAATGAWQLTADPLFAVCEQNNGPGGVCDDRSGDAHTNAYAEIEGGLSIIVMPDTTTLLQGINADVRPESATVEGVIGTGLLARLGTTIDYPGGRVVVTCADASCRSFPRSNHGTSCQTPGAALDDPTDMIFFDGGPARLIAGQGCALR